MFKLRMFIFVSIFFISIITDNCFAQETEEREVLTDNQLKANINVVGIDVSFEKSIASKLTIYCDGGLSYGFFVAGGMLNAGEHFGYELSPFLSVAGRRYYNIEKRYNSDKNIANNAANFLSITAGYRFKPIAYKNIYENSVIAIIPSWGLQRNIGKKFNFEIMPG